MTEPMTAAEPYAILVLRNAIDRRRPTTVRWSDDANAYALCDLRTDTLTPLSDVLTAYDALRAELAQARAEVERVREVVKTFASRLKCDHTYLPEWRQHDHACAQCVPHSTCLQEGFVCTYHQAVALLARPTLAPEPAK